MRVPLMAAKQMRSGAKTCKTRSCPSRCLGWGIQPFEFKSAKVDMSIKMNRISYQKELEKLLVEIAARGERWDKDSGYGKVPTLFLHSCCAPCSSYVLEYLSVYFRITVFYFNPNISPDEEYRKRVEEQKRLIGAYNEEGGRYLIALAEGDYEPACFLEMAEGLEECPEGGARCIQCFTLRLRETAMLGKAGGYDYFATTLTISPMKNAEIINKIGEELAGEYHIRWLPSDFKKKDGYLRSLELSKQYDLYRQDYCGCVFSKQDKMLLMNCHNENRREKS